MLVYRLRKGTALLLLAALCGFSCWALLDAASRARSNGGDLVLTILTTSASLATLYGVARNRRWGRWAGLATALASAVLFLSGTLVFGGRALPLALLGGSLLLGACLVGSSMAARYQDCAPQGRGKLVRWGAVLALASLPMLLLYGLTETPACSSLALRLAAVLVSTAILVGAVLIYRGRTVGALLLLVTGLASLGLTALQLLDAHLSSDQDRGLEVSVLFAGNWGMAAVGSLLLVAALAGPAIRYLRRAG